MSRRISLGYAMTLALLAACSDGESNGPRNPSDTSTTSAGGSGGAAGAASGTSAGGMGATGGGTASGGGGAGGGGASAPTAAQCSTCNDTVFSGGTSCQTAQSTCAADTSCNAWIACTQQCLSTDFTKTCFDACYQQNPNGADLIGPVLACLCTACTEVCAAACPRNP